MANSKKYYLVDYDSVKQNGVEGIENLTETEKVFIFYTEGNHTIEMSFFEKIHSSSADVKLRKISGNGSSSYIISAFAGHIIGNDESAEVHIVSRNNKYSYINDFWKGDYKISIQKNISGIIPEKSVYDAEKSSESTVNDDTGVLLNEVINNLKISQKSKDKIYNIIKCARESYPNNKSNQRSYVKERLKEMFPAHYNTHFKAIEPYI